MTRLTIFGSDVSIVWFWAGIFLLLSMAEVYRTSIRTARRATRFRDELDNALASRRAAVRRIMPHDIELALICRSAEGAISAEDVFRCEEDLDRWIYKRQKSAVADKTGRSLPTVALLEAVIVDLRPFRDRYNEAATLVAAKRRTMPGAIIARAIIDEDPPRLPDPEPI